MPRGNLSKKRGRVFVISAPSGTGKTTLVNRLLREVPHLVRSVSVTTRKPRSGEKEGRDYHFITRKRFDEMIKRGELLEWARVFDNFYGTPREAVSENIRNGKDVLLEIDVQGALQIRKKIKGADFIFIMPPSREELERRLKGRSTENGAQIEERLRVAEGEIKFANKYDHRVINDDIDNALKDLKQIVSAARKIRSGIYMEEVSQQELRNKVGSAYKLVILAARRALELADGAEKLVQTKQDKPSDIALEEIRQGKVTYKVREKQK